jgi:folate-binding Fe-S cluster repair protein YgfZ
MTDLQYATDLAVLRFEGVDAARFLQGYLTCNTTLLEAETWQATALCNLQGRVITSGWARGRANAIDLLVHASLATTTLDFLAPYQRFSRTKSTVLEGVTNRFPDQRARPFGLDGL